MLLGSGEQQSFRPQDFEAYARHVRKRLEQFVAAEPATEPAPCGHCDICGFSTQCGDWWEQVDHLSRVAGCGSLQIHKLAPAGITTMRALASADPSSPPHGINPETFEKLHRQAALQLCRHETGELEFVLLDPQPERGFALLPAPSPGDIFFDIEGNPFWDEQGSLEYLWDSSTPTTRSRRFGPRTTYPSDGPFRNSSIACTSGSRSTPTCTSTITPRTR